MIEIELHNNEDNTIAKVFMHHAPNVGDVIWLLPRSDRKTAFKVDEVCHWVSDEMGYHRVCVYVQDI